MVGSGRRRGGIGVGERRRDGLGEPPAQGIIRQSFSGIKFSSVSLVEGRNFEPSLVEGRNTGPTLTMGRNSGPELTG